MHSSGAVELCAECIENLEWPNILCGVWLQITHRLQNNFGVAKAELGRQARLYQAI